MSKKHCESEHAVIELAGKRFAFFGEFAFWPSYHSGRPSEVAEQRGAIVCETVDDTLDYLVLGERRGSGKAEAKKAADKLRSQAEKAKKKGEALRYPQILEEGQFRELFRVDLTGKKFCFYGGFDCCGGELDAALLTRMVEGVGGVVSHSVDKYLDYLVLGNRRGDGKIAANNSARKLQELGAPLKILSEEKFLELVRTDQVKGDLDSGSMDFATFISQLTGTVDQGKLGRAMKMLKAESFKLYVHQTDERLVGIVKSQQTASGNVYSSWLTREGKYGCTSQELNECMGLQGQVCKHLLVLLVGLTRTGDMQPEKAYAWLKLARSKSPKVDKDLAATTFVEYKGAELGEVDWRPTETIPEDYYAF